jgi:hypothetical protein
MRFGQLVAVCAASVACIGPVRAQTSLPPETMVPAAIRAPDIDPAIARAIARISDERLRAIDSRLVAFGTRSTFSERAGSRRGVLAARTWIAEAFRSIAQHSNGRMTVALDSYVQYGDLQQYMDFAYVARVARYNAANLAALALAPGPPGKRDDRHQGTHHRDDADLDRDDWLFGVRAVDAQGHYGVVAFPLPRRD